MKRRERKGHLLVVCFILAGALAPGRASAQAVPAAKRVVVDLPGAIRMAVAVNPEIRQAQAGVEVAAAKKDQADAGRYAQFDTTAVLGPSPQARIVRERDDIRTTDIHTIESTDSSLSPTINGIFGRADFALVQPLYTFGKISSLREGAAQGINVERARVNEKASEIVLKVKEVYYSLLLTKELKDLISETKDQLDTSLEKVERQLAAGAPGVDEIDRFKLLTFRAELTRRLNEAEKGNGLAREALKTLLGLGRDQEVELKATALEPEVRPVDKVENYLAEARQRRPEFAQIRAGLLAKEALVEAAKSDYYPMLFAALEGSYARATNRSLLRNPFVSDPLNGGGAIPVVGFKWHFDFGIIAGKVSEARAELLKLQHTKELAEKGIPFQVSQVYRELGEAQRNIKATDEAYRNARKWLIAAVANFDLGIGEAKDVGDALLAFVTMRAENFKAIFNYNMGLANLAHATARDLEEAR